MAACPGLLRVTKLAFDALIWLVEQGPRFFDSRAERDAVMSQVVDVLIRDHLETIAEHLTDRNVAMALNMGEQLPTPYRERLLRALFERGRDRQTRGRMGLAPGPLSQGRGRLRRAADSARGRIAAAVGARAFSTRPSSISSARRTTKAIEHRPRTFWSGSSPITATWRTCQWNDRDHRDPRRRRRA